MVVCCQLLCIERVQDHDLVLSDFLVLFSLERLSLRGNGLSDCGAELLGEALSANKTLILLDLAHNRISSKGTKLVANALRMNRTLLSLSLADNKVDDEGAEALAEVHTAVDSVPLWESR